jgi:hypothetical protein
MSNTTPEGTIINMGKAVLTLDQDANELKFSNIPDHLMRLLVPLFEVATEQRTGLDYQIELTLNGEDSQTVRLKG